MRVCTRPYFDGFEPRAMTRLFMSAENTSHAPRGKSCCTPVVNSSSFCSRVPHSMACTPACHRTRGKCDMQTCRLARKDCQLLFFCEAFFLPAGSCGDTTFRPRVRHIILLVVHGCTNASSLIHLFQLRPLLYIPNSNLRSSK